MRNRAKCRLCNEVIESLTSNDHVECGCGAIAVMGGQDKMGCMASDWDNFLRIDDDGKEVKPKVLGDKPPTKDEILNILDEMIERIEGLPQQAMMVSINHYDWLSLLYWLRSSSRVEEPDS